MQSNANQYNTKFYNTSNSSGIDCKLMKLLEVYDLQNGVEVLVASNSSSDSSDINTSSNIYNFGNDLYLFEGGPRAPEFVFYHSLNVLNVVL